jgi:hypothetical protein
MEFSNKKNIAWLNGILFIYLFILVGVGFELRALASQALYHLSHVPSPFNVSYYLDRFS